MTIPTEPIGSIPRPPELMTAIRELAAGRMTAGEYDKVADTAVRDTVELAAQQLGL